MDLTLLNTIPEQLQIIIATGYLGYSIARSGYRQDERRDDVLYGVLVYGLFGYVAYDLLRPHFTYFFIPATAAAAASVISALVWRKWLHRRWYNMLHKWRISNEDNIPNVWSGVIQRTDIIYTQVVLYLKDGTTLECDELEQFDNAPIPRFYTDNEGNFALYVTHRGRAGEDEVVPVSAVRDAQWGDRLTFVPAEDITRIELRVKSND